jgi:hypothetical protein
MTGQLHCPVLNPALRQALDGPARFAPILLQASNRHASFHLHVSNCTVVRAVRSRVAVLRENASSLD